jgi:hypothetical protein
MIARRRKTLAVCHSCHQKIHHGKMDWRYCGKPYALKGARTVWRKALGNLL